MDVKKEKKTSELFLVSMKRSRKEKSNRGILFHFFLAIKK